MKVLKKRNVHFVALAFFFLDLLGVILFGAGPWRGGHKMTGPGRAPGGPGKAKSCPTNQPIKLAPPFIKLLKKKKNHPE
jgi:hypothetical protein